MTVKAEDKQAKARRERPEAGTTALIELAGVSPANVLTNNSTNGETSPPKKRNRGRWYLVTGYEGYDTKAQVLAALTWRTSAPFNDADHIIPGAIIHGHLLMLKPVTRYELEPAPKE